MDPLNVGGSGSRGRGRKKRGGGAAAHGPSPNLGFGMSMAIARGGGGNASGGIIGPNGVILEGRERDEYCRRMGLCRGCGTKTHKVKAWKRQGLTNELVLNGICLRCNPGARKNMTAEVEAVLPRTDSQHSDSGNGGAAVAAAVPASMPSLDESAASTESAGTGTAAPPAAAAVSTRSPSLFRHSSSNENDGGGGGSGGIGERFRSKWGKARAAKTAMTLLRPEEGVEDDDDGQTHDSDLAVSGSNLASSSGEDPQSTEDTVGRTEGVAVSAPKSDEEGKDKDDDDYFERDGLATNAKPSFSHPEINNESDAIRVMQANEMDRAVLTHALNGLRSVGPAAAGVAAEGNDDDGSGGDSLKEIVQAMRRHPREGRLQAAACGAIWRLLASSLTVGDDSSEDDNILDRRKADAIKDGCLDCVLSALKSIPGDVQLACWGIGAMTSMAGGAGENSKENVLAMFESGALGAIESALRNHVRSADVLEWSARALHCFACPRAGLTEDEIAPLRNSTVLSALLTCMQHNIDATVAQEWAFAFIWRLINYDRVPSGEWEADEPTLNLLKRINDGEEGGCGGAALCMQILWTSTTSEKLQELSLALLYSLVRPRTGSLSLEETITICKTLMKEYPTNISIQEIALSVLADAMPDYEKMITEGRGIRSILKTMETHASSTSIQGSACWILWALSTNRSHWTDPSLLSDATRAVSFTRGSLYIHDNVLANFALLPNVDLSDIPIDVIVGKLSSALSRGDGGVEEELVRAACRAISNVCVLDVSKVDAVVKAGGADAFVKVMTMFRLNESAQEEAMSALCQVLSSSNDENRKAVVTAGGMSAIVDAMQEFNLAEDIQTKGLYALCMLAMCQGDGAPIIREGVINVVVKAMGNFLDHTDIQTRSCLALRNLSLAANASSAFSAVESINSLVELIHRSNSSVLQKEACGAIYALIANCPERTLIPLFAAFNAMMKILNENQGDNERPFNAVILNEALGCLGILTGLAIEQNKDLNITMEIVDVFVAVAYASIDAEFPNAEVVEGILAVFLNLSKDSEYEMTLIQCGCIVAVIDGMHEMEGVSGIAEIGCEVLARLCTTNLEAKYCIMESDGIESLISAMVQNSENEKLQKNACTTLAQLTIDEESRYLITQQGGVLLIVGAMQKLPEDLALQEEACSALCDLARDMQEEVLIASNVLDAVLATMKNHANTPTVQVKALGILQNLAMRNAAMKDMVASSGGVEAILSVMKESMASPNVIEGGFTALWSLAVLDRNQERIADADGIKVIINAMMASVDLAKVQKQACGCLCTLSAHPRCKESIKNQDGLDAILFSMWSHFNSETLLIEACRTMSSLAVSVSNEEVIIVKGTVIDAVMTAMRQFPDSGKLLELACLALRNLCLSATNVETMREKAKELEPLLNKASAKFPGECSERANQVITRLIG